MSIVVATALGPYDHDAREVAGLLAKRMQQRVALVHVLEKREPPEHTMRGMLDRAAHEMGRFGVAVEQVLLSGDAVTALTDYARQVAPRLIIIGGAAPADPRGKGECQKAKYLLKALQVPVLLVPHAGPLMQALMGSQHLRVLVQLEHDATADRHIMREARALNEIAPCDLSIRCASSEGPEGRNVASRTRAMGNVDVVVLDASQLDACGHEPFGRETRPMLFVPRDVSAVQTDTRRNAISHVVGGSL